MTDFDEIQALWKEQPTRIPEVDMTQIAAKATRFHKLVAFRNLSEWAACALVIVIFIAMALSGEFHLVSRVGAILIAIGAALIAHRLVLDGRLRQLPDPSVDTQSYIATYRANLEEQAALLEQVWRWYLGPLVPGMVVFLVGFALQAPDAWARLLPVAATCIAVFLAIGWVNGLAARKLRQRAAKLDVEPNEPSA